MTHIDLNGLIGMLSDADSRTRSSYHLTVGELLQFLETCGESKPVIISNGDIQNQYPSNPHSYRGYYSDLAFEPSEDPIIAKDLRNLIVNNVLDLTFDGYKGGDYVMGKDTPIWIAEYGIASNLAVIHIIETPDDIRLVCKQID